MPFKEASAQKLHHIKKKAVSLYSCKIALLVTTNKLTFFEKKIFLA